MLPEAIQDVDRFILSIRKSPELSTLIGFVVEEIFTNMVKYNSGGPPSVSISLELDDRKIAVIMEDQSETPFDITLAKPVDTDMPLMERSPGGLGIHLVKQMMDEIKFEYYDGANKTTLIKYLENANV